MTTCRITDLIPVVKLKKIVKGLKSSALLFGMQNIQIVFTKGIRTKLYVKPIMLELLGKLKI